MQDFRNLKAWRHAHRTVLLVYDATKMLPNDERFGLVDQLRRAAISAAANIAEGCGRGTLADELRFYQIAMASASELECLWLLVKDLDLATVGKGDAVGDAVVETRRTLMGLIQANRSRR